MNNTGYFISERLSLLWFNYLSRGLASWQCCLCYTCLLFSLVLSLLLTSYRLVLIVCHWCVAELSLICCRVLTSCRLVSIVTEVLQSGDELQVRVDCYWSVAELLLICCRVLTSCRLVSIVTEVLQSVDELQARVDCHWCRRESLRCLSCRLVVCYFTPVIVTEDRLPVSTCCRELQMLLLINNVSTH
jgi:hypothetical protein